MTTHDILSDIYDESFDRKNPRRSCSLRKQDENGEEKFDSEKEEGELSASSSEPVDNTSDEDFSLNMKVKKKRKKVKRPIKEELQKEPRKKRVKKVVPKIPSFDEVLLAQITHAQSYVNYEDFESENSSINDDQESLEDLDEIKEEVEEREREQTPPPTLDFPPKRKRVIIYPWNPIGITGGRPPINDVRELD